MSVDEMSQQDEKRIDDDLAPGSSFKRIALDLKLELYEYKVDTSPRIVK